jgi:hypothetical protein
MGTVFIILLLGFDDALAGHQSAGDWRGISMHVTIGVRSLQRLPPNTCDDFNVTGLSISDNACFVGVTDEVPVAVSLELRSWNDPDFAGGGTTQLVGNFRTGDIL